MTGASDVRIRPLVPADADELTALRARNRAFLAPWEPRRDEDWDRPEAERERLERAVQERASGRSYAFGIALADGALVGTVTLTEIVRGPFANAYLGYWVDQGHGGRGYATAAVAQVVDFAFGAAGIHRLQAAVMPRNLGSVRVLERTGFRREGLALDYLEIDGAWEDHLIFALTAADRAPPSLAIRRLGPEDTDWTRETLLRAWGSTLVIRRGEALELMGLPGLVAELDGDRAGLLTYRLDGAECEVASLNSLVESRGVGGGLLDAVAVAAGAAGCRRLWLVTTNDNLRALRLYQRRGWMLVALRPGALDEVRRRKPGIPGIGLEGIPLRDELELELRL